MANTTHACPGQCGHCRWTVERMRCGRPSVVRLNRARVSSERPQWWHYCERHMFGRRLRDGVLETRILRERVADPGTGEA